jgi:hypothetical protein
MMKWLAAVLPFSLIAVAGAQERKPDTPTAPGTALITVDGCLRGSVLELAQTSGTRTTARTLNASEFSLQGSKELLQMLKADHEGHHIEIVGVARVPPRPTEERIAIETKDLGRAGRITIGRRERAGKIDSTPQPVYLEVQSFKHVNDRCINAR